MGLTPLRQDLLAGIVAALLAWGLARLADQLGIPLLFSLAAGAVAGALLLRSHLKSARASRAGTPTSRLFSVELPRSWVLALWSATLVAALVLRLYGLTDRPTWADEMWTLRNSYTSSWAELLRVAFDDYWPPLHYLILNTVARVADTGLLWLRLPSVLFGVGAVAVIYPLGHLLFRNRVAALASAALLAGMVSHVLYSQEARVYSLQVLLAVASAWFFYRSYWERRISPAFLLSTSLLTYAHSFSSWYFIAAQCVYVVLAGLLWRDRRALIKGTLSQVLVFLLWLPLLGAFAYARLARDIVVPTRWATGVNSLPGMMDVVEQYQGLAVRSWPGAAFLTLMLGLALLPLVRGVVGREPPTEGPGASLEERTRYAQALLFLLCWVTVPVLFSLAVTAGSSLDTFGEIRYHLAVLPGLCLLAAAGFSAIQSRAIALGAGAIIVLLPATELPRHFRNYTLEAMDQAAELVREKAGPEERLYVGEGYRAFGYYYRGVFPRIGSAQWDSLAAAHAGLTDRYTLESVKWGDTYAYEKLAPNIVFFGYYFKDRPDRFEAFIADELARGGFQGSFWLVLSVPKNQRFLDALSDAGVSCADPDTYHVPGLELIHCNVRGAGPAGSAQSGGDP